MTRCAKDQWRAHYLELRAYRACNGSNTWLVKSVKELVILEVQGERYCMQARYANEDQIDVDVIEDELDDRHKGVWNRGQRANGIRGHFSENCRVDIEEILAFHMSRSHNESVDIRPC